MISELIQFLLQTAYKHKSVNYVGYKRELDINDQHNTPSFQFLIESDSGFLENQIVEGIITLRLNMDIIGFVGKDASVLDIQDEATHIGFDFIEYIKNQSDFPLEVHDFSFLSLTEYTDDNSSGIRLTIQFVIPSPINLCEYENNFEEKEEPIVEHLDLSNGDECTESKFPDKGSKLTLNPIRLK